ncbi:MAG: CPBP family intramembrane metalloprotease [Corynebacterium sp.]|uniref:CPBP family intramembrane glutamic endopeptidase n=1 Tax=Corynebacterium sp. TaxID=1720 RepID=UPI0026DF9793|nr:CPBP family intramembrane glutamic endopeptidase [Corynebacterium sp.]MDO5671162.1 CPBP family intramembrane metalloprotease [Corynebacterium sp.]
MNRLATHLTTWRAWYAILSVPAFLLGSLAVMGGAAFVPVSFVLFAFLALAFLALASRRWPSRADLGLKWGLSGRDIVVVLVVFVVTHAAFWLLGRLAGGSQGDQATQFFQEMNLDGPLGAAVVATFSSVVLAPICEEILYRGAVVRPIHDAFARRGRAWLGAALGIGVSALLFAMPHLAEDKIDIMSIAYVLTGVGFGLVYVLTGSMTAAMVSHSLQSMAAFGQVLIFGRGDTDVHPVIWILVFGCPLWVYLGSQLLRVVLPRGASSSRVVSPGLNI